MDRVSKIGVALTLSLLLAWYYYMATHVPPRPVVTKSVSVTTPLPNAAPTNTVSEVPSPSSNTTATIGSALPPNNPAPSVPEVITSLEANQVRYNFTSAQGALKTVEILDQKEGFEGHIILNNSARRPLLQLNGWGEQLTFTLKDQQSDQITYQTDLPNGLHWERAYKITAPYVVSLEDRLTNPKPTDINLEPYNLCLGNSEPLHVGEHHQKMTDQYLGTAFYDTAMRQIIQSDFNASYTLWLFPNHPGLQSVSNLDKNKTPTPILWAAAQNQFFAQVLTPLGGRTIQQVIAYCYNSRDNYGNVRSNEDPDLETFTHFTGATVPAGKSLSLSYSLFAGPKDYDRLGKLGETQSTLMNYGWFYLLIIPMLWILRFYHGVVCHLGWAGQVWGWGWAIILLTATVKIITWPVQNAAYAAGKKMQAIAPEIKKIQEEFKDEPEKMQKEVWALYRKYGVNPLGGCWTALIQMPVFFSLYFMLQSAVDLRGAPFLWAHDLSQPDTIFTFAYDVGQYISINPLPILVTVTMMIMMRLTPMASADPTQAKVAQFMPLIFLFIFYNFVSALSLYYVVNNSVSIVQVYRNLKKPIPELKPLPKKKRT